MSTIDLSRQLGDQHKHYAGVRHQQGRVLTDDDFNEASILETEELRRTRLHAIGSYGAPGAGFLPRDFSVSAGGKLDFKLSAGELYLGGLRLENEADEPFLEQKDWLNFDPAGAPAAPAAGQSRTDLVWIEAWQQPVTATEDDELFEVALGGPDTATRWRTMRRVSVLPGVTGNACPAAWAAAQASFAAMGTMAADMEIVTAATLKVGFTAPSGGDLCSPAKPGGYLGAENQAIRVQMIDATHYTWGFDNAAPLYRAKVSPDGLTLELVTVPRDAGHWPLKDQVVEILPWSAALPNRERIADIAGHVCKVAVSYDPDGKTLKLDAAVPASFWLWKNRLDAPSFAPAVGDEYVYLRLWNRGDDLASPAKVPVATSKLGNTGLGVTFNGGPLRPADHWIIAARPAAPHPIQPWLLTLGTGAPPNGVRRYRAPLGMIRWTTAANGSVTGVLIDDCRPPFLPLTRIRGCCTVTVGDGIESFGMFDTIQAAIASLPEVGGCVCVLPGIYREAVRIESLGNVTVHGCGPRSRIVSPEAKGEKSSAITIVDSSDIAIESLALEGGDEPVVRILDSEVIRVAECVIQYRDENGHYSPWAAVHVEGRGIEIEDNIIEPLPGELARIRSMIAAPKRVGIADAARGGVQLAGGCTLVRIAGNVIGGGMGNGVTLGSILRFDANTPGGTHVPDIDDDDPCACAPTDKGAPGGSGGTGKVWYESAGDLYDIEIAGNVITRHGVNGIGVIRFFGIGDDKLPLITVNGLRITGNRITRCLRREIAPPTSKMMLFLGYGGIALALVADLEIDGNEIAGNGRSWHDPVCGIFVLAVDGLRIEHNVIRANGPADDDSPENATAGIRAGIHIWLALSMNLGGTSKYEAKLSGMKRRVPGVAQLRIHANQVEQPLGRALFLLGAGPMLVSDNRFVSEGVSDKVNDPIARTVLIVNFGISREWTLMLLLAFMILIIKKLGIAWDIDVCEVAKFPGKGLNLKLPSGKLAFTDNQVTFNMPEASDKHDFSSVLLFSLDDVSACDNSFEYHAGYRTTIADLIAFGMTVRTSDNRLSETWRHALHSIRSVGLLNTAADNQSTHCLSIDGWRTNDFVHNNLIFGELFCDGLCSGKDGIGEHLATGAYKTLGPLI